MCTWTNRNDENIQDAWIFLDISTKGQLGPLKRTRLDACKVFCIYCKTRATKLVDLFDGVAAEAFIRWSRCQQATVKWDDHVQVEWTVMIYSDRWWWCDLKGELCKPRCAGSYNTYNIYSYHWNTLQAPRWIKKSWGRFIQEISHRHERMHISWLITYTSRSYSIPACGLESTRNNKKNSWSFRPAKVAGQRSWAAKSQLSTHSLTTSGLCMTSALLFCHVTLIRANQQRSGGFLIPAR